MNTAKIVRLIREDHLLPGAYTVEVKPGLVGDVLGKQFVLYTHDKPNADILAFSVPELLLVIDSARSMPIDRFKSLILAKQMFNGTILQQREARG